MQLNLKTGILTLVAAISLVACSESYPGLLYDESGSKATNTEGLDSANLVPLYVYVNKQSFFTVTATPGDGQLPSGVTRGIGSFQPITSPTDEKGNPIVYTEEDSLRYYQTNFRLFAFRDGRYATTGSAYPAELANDPDMTWTLLAEDGSGHRDEEKLNCLVDGYSYYAGLSSHLDNNSGLAPEVKNPLCYGTYQDVGYNFFAYVSDDLEASGSTVHRTRDSIYYDVTLNGTQDVMCGYAPKLTAEVLDERYSQVELTPAERSRVLNIGNYSTYAAHRNIDPYVDVFHMLTRLQFRAYPGDETATGTTIDSIYVEAPNKGKFIVAHRDPTKVGLYLDTIPGRYYLHEKPEIVDSVQADSTTRRMLRNSVMMPAGKYKAEWKDAYWIDKAAHKAVPIFERDHIDVGASMMLPQSPEFVITICSTYIDATGGSHVMKSHYRVTAGSLGDNPDNWDEATQQYVFKRARYYTINLAVYGLQPIQVIGNIEAWKEGGEIYIDPDAE